MGNGIKYLVYVSHFSKKNEEYNDTGDTSKIFASRNKYHQLFIFNSKYISKTKQVRKSSSTLGSIIVE